MDRRASDTNFGGCENSELGINQSALQYIVSQIKKFEG